MMGEFYVNFLRVSKQWNNMTLPAASDFRLSHDLVPRNLPARRKRTSSPIAEKKLKMLSFLIPILSPMPHKLIKIASRDTPPRKKAMSTLFFTSHSENIEPLLNMMNS
jgi:hypothetical protein